MTSAKSQISVLNFFIFNSAYCQREDEEHHKILFFYPPEEDLNIKIKCVGLCEAVIKFSETFGTSPCEALHTQKTKQLFLEPEPGFVMVIVLNVPFQQKTKDGQTVTEYFTEEIQDHVYQSLLLKSYRMFTLMYGPFHSIVSDNAENIPLLKKQLSQFFDSYLMNLKANDADLLDIFQGIHFLPLNSYSFLKVLCFINQVEEKLSWVKYSVFLYNDQLVWSGLEPEDMQLLYQHLSLDLVPAYIQQEVSKSGSMGPHFGRFMTGPKSLEDDSGIQNVPKIYLNDGNSCCHLIAYRALNATICLLVDDSISLTIEHFKSLDNELGILFTSLATEVGEYYTKTISQMNSSDQSKLVYMYFNHMNLAEKTTMHSDSKSTGHILVQMDLMKLCADFHYDLSKMKDFGEMIGKTVSDVWVVGKLADERELYVILQQKNATIMDINDELRKLSSSQFQNIFNVD